MDCPLVTMDLLGFSQPISRNGVASPLCPQPPAWFVSPRSFFQSTVVALQRKPSICRNAACELVSGSVADVFSWDNMHHFQPYPRPPAVSSSQKRKTFEGPSNMIAPGGWHLADLSSSQLSRLERLPAHADRQHAADRRSPQRRG